MICLGIVLSWNGIARTWTDFRGRTIDATFIKRIGSVVYLKRNDNGKEITIPYARLSVADQQHITQLMSGGSLEEEEEKPLPFIEETLGDTLYTESKKKVNASVLHDKVIVFYFSASWCGPCRNFTPKLKAAYQTLKKEDAPVEIVLINGDQDKGSMFDYMDDYEMPWFAMKHDRKDYSKLCNTYNVTGIPSVVVVNDQGDILHENAYRIISQKGVEPFHDWIGQLKKSE